MTLHRFFVIKILSAYYTLLCSEKGILHSVSQEYKTIQAAVNASRSGDTVLVDVEMVARTHSQLWNAVEMPSAIYLYRLQKGTMTETKKLVVVR